MPVGHRLAWIGEHLVPVLSAQVVGVVADAAHSDDLIMAHAVGGEDVLSAAAFPIGRLFLCPSAAVCRKPSIPMKGFHRRGKDLTESIQVVFSANSS